MGYDPITKSNLILDLIAKRQELVSANIANSNTPGYIKKDINFGQYLSTAESPLETKLSQKMGPGPVKEEVKGEVSVADELVKMQENYLFYSIATRHLTNVITEMKTVTQVGK